jgi:histidine triad (HIT) family protein
MRDPNCIFCKIAGKEIPADVIHENNVVMAFRDIKPLAPGHTLLIPKEHYQWFYEVPETISCELFKSAQIIARDLKESYKADYIELKIVGIDVPHTHIHLIPRHL